METADPYQLTQQVFLAPFSPFLVQVYCAFSPLLVQIYCEIDCAVLVACIANIPSTDGDFAR
eukprot:503526-Rhodomonas_salina.1